MNRFINWFRLVQINIILLKHTVNRSVLGEETGWLRYLSYCNPWSWSAQKHSRGESMRLAFESLGPVFVKFGQLLSTRHDLLPEDVIGELSKLQDQVPPFPGSLAKIRLEQAFNRPILQIFKEFDLEPLASASMAQVHTAELFDGTQVVVKVLRPNLENILRRDIRLMYAVAHFAERFWSQGKRLHPVAIVQEFEQTLIDELDMIREAANASQLRRNFADSPIIYVPKVYWDYCRSDILVMERISGIPIDDVAALTAHHADLKKLAERGVEIFFTQVFRDSFFHADMHPGNLFVDISNPADPRYIGVDFGIMGTLSPGDQRYLAENLLAFFNRDYRRVAILHVECGWVPPHTRIDQFESAIRTVSEPIFEQPLIKISFGYFLLRLFQTAERFQMEVQPQLILLQKTLLNIEGLGRQLFPDLDLWNTAKPFLEQFIKKQKGPLTLVKQLALQTPEALQHLIRLPALTEEMLLHLTDRQKEARFNHARAAVQLKKAIGNARLRGFFTGCFLMLGCYIAYRVLA